MKDSIWWGEELKNKNDTEIMRVENKVDSGIIKNCKEEEER